MLCQDVANLELSTQTRLDNQLGEITFGSFPKTTIFGSQDRFLQYEFPDSSRQAEKSSKGYQYGLVSFGQAIHQ